MEQSYRNRRVLVLGASTQVWYPSEMFEMPRSRGAADRAHCYDTVCACVWYNCHDGYNKVKVQTKN